MSTEYNRPQGVFVQAESTGTVVGKKRLINVASCEVIRIEPAAIEWDPSLNTRIVTRYGEFLTRSTVEAIGRALDYGRTTPQEYS